ncbi:hypothetical protein A5648_14560 [Mycolicibacter sinensis]|uniref:Uncharacterized protein n=1 Tax=Mycolicibacter sinensis (strain JDM601) TaxID=875328 RepID=A0A1A3U8S1_MYCSD|nr:hypothetical protein A5648_14560 [Mycolicibacter sinensis]
MLEQAIADHLSLVKLERGAAKSAQRQAAPNARWQAWIFLEWPDLNVRSAAEVENRLSTCSLRYLRAD